MKKLIVYIKNFMLKLSFLLKASWQSFYQRLFLVWKLGLNRVCILLLLMFLSMVATISCSSDDSSPTDYKFDPIVGFYGDLSQSLRVTLKSYSNFINGSSATNEFILNFGEDVSGFTADDIVLDGAIFKKLSFSSDSKRRYTLKFRLIGRGDSKFIIKERSFKYDASGEFNPKFSVEMNGVGGGVDFGIRSPKPKNY